MQVSHKEWGDRLHVYGALLHGGDGQPQSQPCLFTRYAYLDQPLEDAVSLPRWVLGRTWGKDNRSLKLEGRPAALIRDADGYIEGAADPAVMAPPWESDET